MQGEEVGEKDDLLDHSHGISLHHASLLWKLTITLAGPAANFLLAVIINTIIFAVGSEEFVEKLTAMPYGMTMGPMKSVPADESALPPAARPPAPDVLVIHT